MPNKPSSEKNLNAASLSRMSLSEIMTAVANDNRPKASDDTFIVVKNLEDVATVIKTLMEENPQRRLLLERFNKASSRPHFQPARQFEDESGLSDIAGRYIFPEDIAPAALEEMLVILPLEETLPVLQDVWRRVGELNPELQSIIALKNDPCEIYYSLVGVTSGFNADDINYFIELQRQGVPPAAWSMEQPAYRQLHDEIESRAGAPIYWVPAPATMDKIKAKLDRTPKA